MKKLIWFTILNTTSMVLLIASRITSDSKGFDWLIFVPAVLIVLTLIHFFVERNKLNKLK
ncbi:hypothetical protein [Psychroserpens sp.]